MTRAQPQLGRRNKMLPQCACGAEVTLTGTKDTGYYVECSNVYCLDGTHVHQTAGAAMREWLADCEERRRHEHRQG